MSRPFRTLNRLPDLDLDPVGVFSGGPITVWRQGRNVYARGSVSRSPGSSGTFTTCVDTMPAAYRPAATVGFPAAVFYATTTSYRFQVTSDGEIQVRMSGADTDPMFINATWPAAA